MKTATRRFPALRRWGWIAPTMALSLCAASQPGGLRSKIVELAPTHLATLYAGPVPHGGGSFGCVPVSGLDPGFVPKAGEVLCGYYMDRGLNGGCGLLHSYEYWGCVRFDLSQFDKISSAELRYHKALTLHSDGVTSCAALLGLLKFIPTSGGLFVEGPPQEHFARVPPENLDHTRSAGIGYDEGSPLPATGRNFQIDVTRLVNRWVEKPNPLPNSGFVLLPGNYGPGENPQTEGGEGCVAAYSGFKLVVTYDTELNPLAPR